MHDDELRVDLAVARDLIGTQFPKWAGLPIKAVTTPATMNSIFRVGESLVARFPLRHEAPETARAALLRQMAAAQEFHDLARVPCPEPVALGEPGLGYPMPWTLHTWLPGNDGLTEDPAGSSTFATDLARLIHTLRSVDARGRRFSGPGRGGRLTTHDEWMELCFARSAPLVAVAPLRDLWAELRLLPDIDPDVMSHGDLTPANVLVHDGRLTGVLDTGGFGAADPALDLVSAWHLLDRPERDLLRRDLNCSDVQWARGMAWALHQAIGLVWYYADSNPQMAECGKRSLKRIVDQAMR